MPLYITKNQAAKWIGIPVVDFENLVSLGLLPEHEEGLSVERWEKIALRCYLRRLDIGRALAKLK